MAGIEAKPLKKVKKQRKIVSEILLDKIRREGSFVNGFR